MTWHCLEAADHIAEGEMKRYVINGKDIAVAHIFGQFFAFDDTCSHAEVSLADGMLEGFEVECCAHGARFDIRSGAVKCLPATESIATYPVKREGDGVYVELR